LKRCGSLFYRMNLARWTRQAYFACSTELPVTLQWDPWSYLVGVQEKILEIVRDIADRKWLVHDNLEFLNELLALRFTRLGRPCTRNSPVGADPAQQLELGPYVRDEQNQMVMVRRDGSPGPVLRYGPGLLVSATSWRLPFRTDESDLDLYLYRGCSEL